MYIGNEYYDIPGNSVGNQVVYSMDKDAMFTVGPVSYNGTIKAKGIGSTQ